MSSTEYTLDESQITQIGQLLESRNTIDEAAISKLRDAYPNLRFTLCSEDDIGERESYQTYTNFDLHLVASIPGSCSHLTYYLEQCTGILIALHEE